MSEAKQVKKEIKIKVYEDSLPDVEIDDKGGVLSAREIGWVKRALHKEYKDYTYNKRNKS